MATNYNGYVIDAQGNATPISDPHALQRGESVERADVAANAEMLGGMLPSEFAKAREGGIAMELLWENASPDSAFVAQTLSIDLSGYQMIGLVFKWTKTWGYQPMAIMEKGSGQRYISGAGMGGTVSRQITEISDTKIVFGTAYANAGENTSTCIPVKIYGIKGVA